MGSMGEGGDMGPWGQSVGARDPRVGGGRGGWKILWGLGQLCPPK